MPRKYLSKRTSWNKIIHKSYMKGSFYKDDMESILFIESNDHQAQEIYKISGKPVLSIEKNILYGGE